MAINYGYFQLLLAIFGYFNLFHFKLFLCIVNFFGYYMLFFAIVNYFILSYLQLL
jgi:hypothetical protein